MLVDAEPSQFVIENFRVFVALEVAVLRAPVGDGARDAMHELAHGAFAPALLGIEAVGDVAVEILRDGDLGREHAPIPRHLDVFLLEDRLAGIVGDLGGALFPFEFVVGMDAGLGEDRIEGQALFLELRLTRFARDHGCGVNTRSTGTGTTTISCGGLGRDEFGAADAGHGGFHKRGGA